MNVEIETITPLHIGTGRAYNKNEYIASGKLIKRLKTQGFYRELGRKHLNDLIEERKRMGMQFDLRNFLNKNGIEIADENIWYSLENNSGFPVDKIREIREHVRSGIRPFIPGSSIKGALRTAVLWHYVREHLELLDMLKNIAMNRNKMLRFFTATVFFVGENDKNNRASNDAKYDLFKFLNVSDFMPKTYSLNLEVLKTYSLKTNGVLENWKTLRNGQRIYLSNYVEGVKGTFYGTISLSPNICLALKSSEYSLLEKKLSLLGIEATRDIEKMEEQMFACIKKLLGKFNSWAIAHELNLVYQSKNKNLGKGIEAIKLENQNSILMRLGFGVGTVFQTLIKLVEETNKQLYCKLRRRYRLGSYNDLRIPYPKTIDLTSEDKPMGWIKLTTSPWLWF